MKNLAEWIKEDPDLVELHGVSPGVDLRQYEFHHESFRAGYVSRRIRGLVVPYTGRFGVGYQVLIPNWGSSQYCYVRYYIKREA